MGVSPQHFTLVANTVKTFNFDVDFAAVRVTNVDGVAAVYFTTDGSTPGVAQDGSQVLPAAVGATVDISPATHGSGTKSVVKVVSAGTPKISVRGL